jgi:hypothetical protein
MRPQMAKNQRLIPEMRSSATDTGDKASASADYDLQPFEVVIDFLMQFPGLSGFLGPGGSRKNIKLQRLNPKRPAEVEY